MVSRTTHNIIDRFIHIYHHVTPQLYSSLWCDSITASIHMEGEKQILFWYDHTILFIFMFFLIIIQNGSFNYSSPVLEQLLVSFLSSLWWIVIGIQDQHPHSSIFYG